MDIAKIPEKFWVDVLSGRLECAYEFLAFKMLLVRLKMVIKSDQSSGTVQKCVKELKGLFTGSMNIPSAQKDLTALLSKGGIRV
jgi:hypothetical protein